MIKRSSIFAHVPSMESIAWREPDQYRSVRISAPESRAIFERHATSLRAESELLLMVYW